MNLTVIFPLLFLILNYYYIISPFPLFPSNPSRFYPHSPSNPLPFFQLIVITYIYVYVNTYIFSNVVYSVHMLIELYFQGWQFGTSQPIGVLFPREVLPLPDLPSCVQVELFMDFSLSTLACVLVSSLSPLIKDISLFNK